MTKQEFILKDAPELALLLTSDGKVNKRANSDSACTI